MKQVKIAFLCPEDMAKSKYEPVQSHFWYGSISLSKK